MKWCCAVSGSFYTTCLLSMEFREKALSNSDELIKWSREEQHYISSQRSGPRFWCLSQTCVRSMIYAVVAISNSLSHPPTIKPNTFSFFSLKQSRWFLQRIMLHLHPQDVEFGAWGKAQFVVATNKRLFSVLVYWKKRKSWDASCDTFVYRFCKRLVKSRRPQAVWLAEVKRLLHLFVADPIAVKCFHHWWRNSLQTCAWNFDLEGRCCQLLVSVLYAGDCIKRS